MTRCRAELEVAAEQSTRYKAASDTLRDFQAYIPQAQRSFEHLRAQVDHYNELQPKSNLRPHHSDPAPTRYKTNYETQNSGSIRMIRTTGTQSYFIKNLLIYVLDATENMLSATVK